MTATGVASSFDFNPRSPCGERPHRQSQTRLHSQFQSTLPVRGATLRRVLQVYLQIFQSTLPVRGATRIPLQWRVSMDISIHAPRAGSDKNAVPVAPDRSFQSTLPVRGATPRGLRSDGLTYYFNPRSPCGERRSMVQSPRAVISFQSTLPVRGATRHHAHAVIAWVFQSTLPVRGATQADAKCSIWI